ncbi:hypothetical protein DEU40_102200 [Chryseobacterium sp. AG844]|nr:hypothetical protein DEU40_102200 [Chryseobacterium sp. AG844]
MKAAGTSKMSILILKLELFTEFLLNRNGRKKVKSISPNF